MGVPHLREVRISTHVCCAPACTCKCMHTHTRSHTHSHTLTHSHTHTLTHSHIHTDMCARTCTHAHTHAHTRTHTHVHVQLRIRMQGVTVGDRAAHQPVMHTAQLVYFALTAAALLLAPLLVGHLGSSGLQKLSPGLGCHLLLKPPPPRVLQAHHSSWLAWSATALAILGLCVAALLSAPAPHPYLLADNRHLMFYVWRRLLAPRGLLHVVAMAASATAAWLGMIWALAAAQRQQQGVLWVCGFLVAVVMVLSPAWLLEFRCVPAASGLLFERGTCTALCSSSHSGVCVCVCVCVCKGGVSGCMHGCVGGFVGVQVWV